MTKTLLGKIFNAVLLILLVLVLIQKLPGVIENFKKQDQVAPAFSVALLDGTVFEAVQAKQPLVLVFWATWCGPCDVELARIQKMISSGELSAKSVLAISSFEDRKLVAEIVQDRGYTFQVGLDISGQVAGQFGVRGTPTIVLLSEDLRIHWMTTGLSPLLESRIKSFIK